MDIYIVLGLIACYGLFRYVKVMLVSYRPQFVALTIGIPLNIIAAYAIGILWAYNEMHKSAANPIWQNIMFANHMLVVVLTISLGLANIACGCYCGENGIKRNRY